MKKCFSKRGGPLCNPAIGLSASKRDYAMLSSASTACFTLFRTSETDASIM